MTDVTYARGEYNKFNDKEQWIRISEGCPNNCEFCRETKECGKQPTYLLIPEIVRNKVKIMDMNLIYKPKAKEIIKDLGSRKVNGRVVYYELICGIDWRFMNQELANTLHENRFINIRFAWDYGMNQQMKIKDCLNYLIRSGYKPNTLSCFMICDWKTSYYECFQKLDLLKVWNVKVNDCWYDNTTSPNFQHNYWSEQECRIFRSRCRKHNQLVIFGIDPEYEEGEIR